VEQLFDQPEAGFFTILKRHGSPSSRFVPLHHSAGHSDSDQKHRRSQQ
jgi:hypothetical protein